MTTRKSPRYISVDGYRFVNCSLPESVRGAINYKPRPSDIFVATYPKCGTTWMLQIVILILRKGKVPSTMEEYFASMPFLELMGPEAAENMLMPGCIKTHLPFHLAPYSPEAKYIYVARNPKDCCVSYYHHTKYFPIYHFTDGTFDDFFELFIRGEIESNDYFDHLLSWYEHRNDPNVLFTTYESMKADHRGTVINVAEFLGEQYATAVKEDEELMRTILHYSSLEYMKKYVNDNWNDLMHGIPSAATDANATPAQKKLADSYIDATNEGEVSVGEFIRKGVVGDWKMMLSPEQEEKLNARIIEKTIHSDVMDLWKNIDKND